MASEGLREFFEKVESDKSLQTKLKKVAQKNEREAIARVVKIALEAGFDFTADELAKVRRMRCVCFPGLEDQQTSSDCCMYAQGSMPGFEVMVAE